MRNPKWPRLLLAALIAALLAGLMIAAPAGAATDITVGGSCKVSANWTVNTSANFNNTSGSPSRGTLDYLVMSSPGPLTATASNWVAYNVAGQVVSSQFGHWSYQGFINGKYTYRDDPPSGSTPNVHSVLINPDSNTGVTCDDYLGPSYLYSQN